MAIKEVIEMNRQTELQANHSLMDLSLIEESINEEPEIKTLPQVRMSVDTESSTPLDKKLIKRR